MNSFKNGFTLAEVLITLGIIGVVAAMTLPSLVTKYKEKQNVIALKKAVSVLENAYRLAIYNNGGSNDFGYLPAEYVALPEEEGKGVYYNKNGNYDSDKFFTALSKNLNILKDCGREGQTGCFPEILYNPFNTNTYKLLTAQGKSRRFFVLNDGTSVGVTPKFIYIDVNGLKKPNTLGNDVFQVAVEDNGKFSYYDDASEDVKCYSNAFMCSAWAMINENLDYLHCDDLSWKGKTKCGS